MSDSHTRVAGVRRRGISIVSIAAMVMALLTVVGVQSAAAADAAVSTVTAPGGWQNDPDGTVAPIYTPLSSGDGNGAIDLKVVAKVGDGSGQDANSYAASYYHATNASDTTAGVALGEITELGYSYSFDGDAVYAPVYQLRICADGVTDGTCSGFSTLVWSPATATGGWQAVSIDPASALWTSTRDINGLAGGQSATATLLQIIAANPNAVVVAYGVFRGSTSGNYPSGDGYVDDVSFNGAHTDFQAITLNTCTSTSFDSASSWDFSETRSGGHHEFLPYGGLHVWTDSNTSADKVAGYLTGLDVPLADIGAVSMTLSNVTGTAPGINMYLDNGVTGAGHLEGYIVNEPTVPGSGYADNWWGANHNGAPVNWDLGMFVGGGGSAVTNAPLSAYLNRWPNAHVTQIGFSLGSGVKGDAIIDAITARCITSYPMPAPAPSPVISTPLVTNGWAPDPDGTVAPRFVVGDGPLDGAGSLDLHVNSKADDGGNANTRAASYYHAADGIPLTEALSMGFSEKLGSTDPTYRTVYQLRINGADGGGANGFTTLIWVPGTGTDAGNGWTTYAIDGATATWVSTRAINGLAGGQVGPGKTLADIQADNPDATITAYGVFRGSTDGGYPTGDVQVDDVTLNSVTTNFEPIVPPAVTTAVSTVTAPGGWQNDPDGTVAPIYTPLSSGDGNGAIDLKVVAKVGDGSGQDANSYAASYYHATNASDTTAGVALGEITELGYSYSFDGDAVYAPVYQLRICADGVTDGTCSGFSTLVWSPATATGGWQAVSIDPASALWTSTRDINGLAGHQSATATLPQIIAANPNAVVVAYGVFRGSTSGNYPSGDGYVDDVSFNGAHTDFQASISGTVTAATGGGALAGVRVTMYSSSDGTNVGSAVTKSDGTYAIAGIRVGSYVACFDASAATGGSSASGYLSACVQVTVQSGKTATADLALASAPAEVTCDSDLFVDVTGGLFCGDITWLAGTGITRGTDATHFSPAGHVTRGQMALFLYRMSTGQQNAPACTAAPFTDVPKTATACGAITWLVGQHITTGVDAQHYNPAGSVTRGQMALFLYRMVTGQQNAPACTAAPFTDVPKTATACGAISWLVQTGLTKGTTATTFAPGQQVNRAQMSAFLHRLANRTEIQGTVTGSGSAPLAGVSVIVTGTGGTSATYSTVTGADGTYAVQDIAVGTYSVCFDGSGVAGSNYEYQCYDGVVGGGAHGTVVVARWTPVTVNATLTKPVS